MSKQEIINKTVVAIKGDIVELYIEYDDAPANSFRRIEIEDAIKGAREIIKDLKGELL